MFTRNKQQDKLQRRVLPIEQGALTVRSASEDGTSPTQIVGYAAVFNAPAYGETIKKGAFKKTLKENKDVRAYWNHDTASPLGRQSNGTLTLKEDDRGLYVEITPNLDTTWGRDVLAAVQRGDVTGMSFGFRIINAGTVMIDGQEMTELREVALREVSPVSEPWYEATEATTREEHEDAPGPVPHEDIELDRWLNETETEIALYELEV